MSNIDLKGNLVKSQNCPRNCKCGRNENNHCANTHGKAQSRVKHKSGDLPKTLKFQKSPGGERNETI